jgi:hypothetical protein
LANVLRTIVVELLRKFDTQYTYSFEIVDFSIIANCEKLEIVTNLLFVEKCKHFEQNGSKIVAKWKQNGSKMEAKLLQNVKQNCGKMEAKLLQNVSKIVAKCKQNCCKM